MRPYGVRPADRMRCPGHDRFPDSTYRSRRSHRVRARGVHQPHGRARAENRLLPSWREKACKLVVQDWFIAR